MNHFTKNLVEVINKNAALNSLTKKELKNKKWVANETATST